MNKPLVLIVISSMIYLLSVAISPNAQRVYGKFESAKVEYGFVEGVSKECGDVSEGYNEEAELHYVVQKVKSKIKIDFFCEQNEETESKGLAAK